MKSRELIDELRRIRQKSRISQDAIGAAIGKQECTIRAYERGRRGYAPNIDTMTSWADTLGYELALIPKRRS